MNLSKSIEIATDFLKGHRASVEPDVHDSIQLLIECGKRIVLQRKYNLTFNDNNLPEETR